MAILAINAGSSSFKCSVFTSNLQQIAYNNCKTLQELVSYFKTIKSPLCIGHRVVHGGGHYREPTLITPEVIDNLQTLAELAPLHNGPSIQVIQAAREFFGESIPQVAVFDTAFFKNMPKESRYYAIPWDLAERYEIERFGFHGISHSYLWDSYVAKTGKKDAKILSLHLGAGCSICATKAGIAQDTSMGFTPNEGLIMATRSGDINPEVIHFLAKKEDKTVDEVLGMLNFQSGLLGLSGESSDMQTLLTLYNTHERSRLAIDFFIYRIVKYIGAYIAILGGIDAIIFSGGIGENSPQIRQMILDKLHVFGDIEVFVIPTNENLSIAKAAISVAE